MPLIAYCKWRDAVQQEAPDPHTKAKAELITLEEVGFLLDETEDAILIGMESEGGQPGRWRLHIPKVCIEVLRIMELGKIFPKKLTRRMEV